MLRVAIYLLQALDLALVIWGQQTFSPIIPTFPPPPTKTAVINDSLVLYVGEPIVVGGDVRVTIDCSPVIDLAINSGIPNPTITWFKDGAELSNGSTPNVEISADKRRLKINDTGLQAIGGQIGTDANYTCEVCHSSRVDDVIIDFRFGICATNPPSIAGGQCIPQPQVIPNTDVTVMIGSSAYIVDEYDLTITCNVITGTPPINISWYRNGVVDSSSLGSKSTITISSVDINKDNGVVYTCRAENDEGHDEQLTIVNVFTPLCSHEVCKTRRNILCIIPDSMCLCKPQMGYCSAAYYSTETRSLPERCTRCRIPTDLDCLKTWSQCVKKQDEGAHGRPTRRMRTAANFKMYRHPC